MPRTTKPLSDTQIRQAKPKAKEYTLWDGGGLCLRIKPNGSRSWIYSYYRPTNGKRANLSLGQYPAVSLALARQFRQEQQSVLGRGLDPSIYKSEQLQQSRLAHANTLQQVSNEWLIVKRTKVTKDYAKDVERSLEKHIFPTLGKVPIHELGARQTIEVLKPISASGALETVKRLCQRLNEIMDFAQLTGYVNANTLTGISKAFEAPRKQHLPALQPSELPELLDRLSMANIKISTRCLIEWQFHTMTRPSEAAGTTWEEIDLEKGLWRIPAERMKKRKPHTVPLSPQALLILKRMQAISSNREHVFPGDRNPKTHANPHTANMALKRMGYAGQLVAHGLRSMASTILNEQGFEPDLIEAALAHVDRNEVRAAYNRAEYLERRYTMMCWWSDRLEETQNRKPIPTEHE